MTIVKTKEKITSVDEAVRHWNCLADETVHSVATGKQNGSSSKN